MDWILKQKSCKKCLGAGYTRSEQKHENGRQNNAWASLCECQPEAIDEMRDKVKQQALAT